MNRVDSIGVKNLKDNKKSCNLKKLHDLSFPNVIRWNLSIF